MKRIFKLLLIILPIIIISTEFYWFFKNDGNLIIYIQNQSDKQEIIEVKVKINKEQIFSGELKRNEIIPKEINMVSGLGKKTIMAVRKDNFVEVEQEFNLFFVRWVTVDFYTDKTFIEFHRTPPLFQ